MFFFRSQCLLAANEIVIRLSALSRWAYFSAVSAPIKPDDEYFFLFKSKITDIRKEFAANLHAQVTTKDGCVKISFEPFDKTVGVIYTNVCDTLDILRLISAFEIRDIKKGDKPPSSSNNTKFSWMCSKHTHTQKWINRQFPNWNFYMYVFIEHHEIIIEVMAEWLLKPSAENWHMGHAWRVCVICGELFRSFYRILRYKVAHTTKKKQNKLCLQGIRFISTSINAFQNVKLRWPQSSVITEENT